MKRGFRGSFSVRLITSLSLIFLVTFFLSAFGSYRLLSSYYDTEISRQFSKANSQTMARLALRIQDIYRISNSIVFHPYIEENIRASQDNRITPFERYRFQEQLIDILKPIRFDAPQLTSVYLYDMEGINYYFGNLQGSMDELAAVHFEDLKAQLATTSGDLQWRRMDISSSVESDGTRSAIVAFRWMKNKQADTYGVLVLVYDHSLLSRDLGELTEGENAEAFLFNPQDELLYADVRGANNNPISLLGVANEGGTAVASEKGIPFLFAKDRSQDYGFSLVSKVSLQSLQTRKGLLLQVTFASALLSLLLTSLLVTLTSRRLLAPLMSIVQGMKRVRNGDFYVTIETKTSGELEFLSAGFNEMTREVRRLIQEVYESKLIQREAELKALQAQLNPHFLYNTLNTIYWKLYLKDDKETAQLVSSLSDILKYVLGPAQTSTTLREELNQIRSYIMIQQARMDEEVLVIVEVDEESEGSEIGRLLLQPLVENVFIHGFRERSDALLLEIQACCAGNKLRITISDNGCGMEEMQIQQLLSGKLQQRTDQTRESIGIQSVKRRIELLYGEPFGMSIDSSPGKGTTVTLTLPFRSLGMNDKGESG